ncbi:hypothetical protein EV426DRAFT_600437 [Tirmania nivea]|nr:hypothetical protein EV426DRAFT_600437 [Tirmania nivea]
MPWDEFILEQFQSVLPLGEHDESQYYGHEKMRERFQDLGDRIKIPMLYGVSAIGTKLRFYKYTKDTQQLEPELILGHTKIMVDTAPRDYWSVDVLTPEGEQQFRGKCVNRWDKVG